MKTYKLIGIIGILILIIVGFLPLAHLSDEVITIAPVYNNYDVAKSLWVWKDISAFAITYGLSLIVCFYLLLKNYKPGYLISASLALIAIMFIYFSVWLTSIKVAEFGNVEFKLCYAWIIFLIGFILIFFSGLKIKKN